MRHFHAALFGGGLALASAMVSPALAQVVQNDCPANASGCKVTATGGGQTNTLAVWMQGLTKSGANWSLSGTLGVAGAVTGGAFLPPSNDGAALGTTALSFSDLFLASGGEINWNNSNMRIAHSASALSILGGTLVVGGTTATASAVRFNAAAGTSRTTSIQTAGVARWLHTYGIAESGNNTGSTWDVRPHTDAGVQLGAIIDARRASGLFGNGQGYFAKLAPFVQSAPRVSYPGGVIGNDVNWGSAADTQPSTTLAANPISVVSGSNVVTITWTGASVATGPIGDGTYEVWVNLTGVTATGGITPTGWLQVQSRPTTSTFTVHWTSNATSTAVGGGGAVVVTPSFHTVHDKIFSVATAPSDGYSVQRSSLYAANPVTLKTSDGPQYQQNWSVYNSVNTADTTAAYGSVFHEIDLVNRGPDEGYSPNLYKTARASIGLWAGGYGNVFSWVPGGGTAKSWNTVYSVFSQGGSIGNYTGYSVQPLALASSAGDPTGQGGTGIDIFGNAVHVASNGFATTIGTPTITVSAWVYGIKTMVNGDTVYIPKSYTISGVTFGNASYVVSSVDTGAGTFTITGAGSAAASVSGGGDGQYVLFEKHTPQSPFQIWGGFEHGIRTKFAKFNSGYLIDTQPGAGFRWDNGTASATITATGNAADVLLTLTPGGASPVQVAGPLGLLKIAASGTAPGAANGKIELVCGTNAGTAKLVAYAGTSGTAVTVADNIGSGVSGC